MNEKSLFPSAIGMAFVQGTTVSKGLIALQQGGLSQWLYEFSTNGIGKVLSRNAEKRAKCLKR